jgi:hypothetical protein
MTEPAQPAQPAKCCHYDEGYADGYDVGHETGLIDALEEHECPAGAVSNGRHGATCVRCGRATSRFREVFDQVWVPVCEPCDDGVHLDAARIRDALRLALS